MCAKRCETFSLPAEISGCADICEPSVDEVLSVNGAPTLSPILMILHFTAANHGIRTQITNEIRTLEAFTDNQSHASPELGGCCLSHNELIERHCGI